MLINSSTEFTSRTVSKYLSGIGVRCYQQPNMPVKTHIELHQVPRKCFEQSDMPVKNIY